MVEEYTIISIGDSREVEKAALRRALPIREVHVDSVDGGDETQIRHARSKWPGVTQHDPRKQGELGIIYSVLNVLEYARDHGNLLAFEDDCIVAAGFWSRLNEYVLDSPPEDADFINLAPPDDQRRFYRCIMNYDLPHGAAVVRELRPGECSTFDIGHKYLARAYNTYKNVCMIWTSRGAAKTLALLHRDGLWGQIDDMFMRYAAWGDLIGYCLKPEYELAVESGAHTLIHETDWVDAWP